MSTGWDGLFPVAALVVMGLLGAVMFLFPRTIATASEKHDARGSTRSRDEVEPAGWAVTLCRYTGLVVVLAVIAIAAWALFFGIGGESVGKQPTPTPTDDPLSVNQPNDGSQSPSTGFNLALFAASFLLILLAGPIAKLKEAFDAVGSKSGPAGVEPTRSRVTSIRFAGCCLLLWLVYRNRDGNISWAESIAGTL